MTSIPYGLGQRGVAWAILKKNKSFITIPPDMCLSVAIEGFATTPDTERKKAFWAHIEKGMESPPSALTTRELCRLYEGAIRSGRFSFIQNMVCFIEKLMERPDVTTHRTVMDSTVIVTTSLLQRGGKPFAQMLGPVHEDPSAYWQRCCRSLLMRLNDLANDIPSKSLSRNVVPHLMRHYICACQKDGAEGHLAEIAKSSLGTIAVVYPKEVRAALQKERGRPHAFGSLSAHCKCLDRAALTVERAAL